jgi:hypothetical protein
MESTLPKGHLFLSTMHSERLAGKSETFLRYGVTARLEVGFGYLWQQDVVRPLASYTLLQERQRRPALSGGLFFDALGGGRRAVFVSASKNLRTVLDVPATMYVGGAKISNEHRLRLIAGSNVALNSWLNGSIQFDGKTSHLGLTARVGRLSGRPVFVGLVLTGGSAIGPIAATDIPLVH